MGGVSVVCVCARVLECTRGFQSLQPSAWRPEERWRGRAGGRVVGRGSWVGVGQLPQGNGEGLGQGADSQCLPLSSLKAQVTLAPGGGGLAALCACAFL